MTPSGAPIPQRHGFGILLVVLASLLLAAMNGAVKWLTLKGYPTLQIIFFDGMVGFTGVMGWLLVTGNIVWARRVRPLLAAYVLAAMCACYSLFYAFGHGGLAEISTIVAAAPLLVAVLSFLFLGEKLTPVQIGLALGGFMGILLILQPGGGLGAHLPVLAALLGMICLAVSQVLVRKMSRTVHTAAFVLYFYMGSTLASGLFAMGYWQPIAWADMPVFALSGLCDLVALVLMYTAFRYAPASLVTPFQYSNIVWSALIGYVIWLEQPSVLTIIGAAVIIVTGILFTRSALMRKPEMA